MIHIPRTTLTVGSTQEERVALGQQYGFHPTWLGDELEAREATVEEFWIDRYPVTNRQYAAYLRAIKQPVPPGWDPALLDHPVVNVSGQEAAAYAAWAGKRLPTAQEWECAFQGVVAKPGPIQPSPDWIIQTRPVTAGAVAPSGVGGYGLVSEMTMAAHRGEGEFLAKGPSWIHEEAWSFRPQASHYVGGAPLQYIGFRCAADTEVSDRSELSEPLLEEWLTPTPSQPAPPYDENYASFHFPTGRYFSVRFGDPRGICYFFCPEIVSVGDKVDAHYYTSPTITWQEGENEEKGRRAVYTVQGDYLRTKYLLETGPDWVDMQTVFPNESDEAQRMYVSICVNPYLFNLYDIEGARTYFWFGKGDWRRARELPHAEGRGLTYHAPPTIPDSPRIVAAAAVSRDGATVFGYAKEILGRSYMAHDHANICCFHIEPIVEVPARAMCTVHGRVYFMKGDLEALRRRILADFPG